MKRKTTITLTIAGLLPLAGILYAANPSPFVTGIPFPTGVAAAPNLLLVSEYCSENIDMVDCNGNVSLYTILPGLGSCRQKYISIAPSQSANAGFTPRDVFVTEGALVFRVDGTGTVTLFATLLGCFAQDRTGITFDHFGTFGFDMIVTCSEGNVFRVHGDGTVTQIAAGAGAGIEGPAVVPPGFGPHGGEIWVADEAGNAVHTIGLPPTYTVTHNVLSHESAEGVYVIPNPPCAFCDSPPSAFFLAEQQEFQLVWRYPLTDFVGGNVILTSEGGPTAATSLVSFNGTDYVQTPLGPRVPGINEGSSFVDCDVPLTPPPTPTATAAATATATATASSTPTLSPTASPTPTSSATASPTPTPSATASPTPTATQTPYTAGSLDSSFGDGGIVITDLNGVNDQATSIAVQPDGKILAAGFSKVSGVYEFAVVRYNSNGTLDTSFNGTGKVFTAFPNANLGPYGDKAFGVRVQNDGKIVVAGYATNASFYFDIGVARYNSDGSLDTTFNGTGLVTTHNSSFSDFGSGLVIQPDGRIVVGGHSNDSGSFDQFELVRYNSDGSLDTTFNGSGVVKADIGGAALDDAFSISLQPDGKLVLSGQTYAHRCCSGDFAVARFNSNGSLDTTFNGSGSTITPTGSFFQSEVDVTMLGITLQSVGKVVVAGTSTLGGSGNGDFTLVCYNSDGSLDTGFNGTGTIVTLFGGSGAAARGVAVQSDGKIIATGRADQGYLKLAVVRYNVNGSLDTSFNGTGKVITSAGSYAAAYAIALQSDGKIVVAGASGSGDSSRFVLARYNADTTFTPTPTPTASPTPTPTPTSTPTPTPTPCGPLAAPNAQNATNVTFSSFTANWQGVSGATVYRLDVSTSNSFATYVPGYQDLSVGNVTSYNVTGLSANMTYFYRVRAYDGCATSPNSNVKNAKTLPCTPNTPNAQNATNVTASGFTANWSSVSGAIDYRLDVSTSNTFTTYVPGYEDLPVGNVTSYNVTGLSANTTYFYRVRAYNGCATSANSNVKNIQTLPCTPNTPNAQNATNVTASGFTANWSSVSGAIDYRLDVSTSNSFTTYVPGYQDLPVGNVTSFSVTGLSANTTYFYRVRAYNGCATSSNSNVKNVKTKAH